MTHTPLILLQLLLGTFAGGILTPHLAIWCIEWHYAWVDPKALRDGQWVFVLIPGIPPTAIAGAAAGCALAALRTRSARTIAFSAMIVCLGSLCLQIALSFWMTGSRAGPRLLFLLPFLPWSATPFVLCSVLTAACALIYKTLPPDAPSEPVAGRSTS